MEKKFILRTENEHRWVALPPVCEHFGLDAETEFYRLQGNEWLRKEASVQAFEIMEGVVETMPSVTLKGFIPWIFSHENDENIDRKKLWGCYIKIFGWFGERDLAFNKAAKIYMELEGLSQKMEDELETLQDKRTECLKKMVSLNKTAII